MKRLGYTEMISATEHAQGGFLVDSGPFARHHSVDNIACSAIVI